MSKRKMNNTDKKNKKIVVSKLSPKIDFSKSETLEDENSNICKSFYDTTTDNNEVYADYRLFTTGDTLQTVLNSLNKITGTNGSWTIKNADDTEISACSTISLSNASKFKFVFTSSVCYIKNIGTDYDFIIHFFDHEPNANEFDIAS